MLKHRLVAHRGDMTRYPENSLLAFYKAIELGYAHIELDIQLSSDSIPVVIHDDNLLRTVGIDADVFKLNLNDIQKHSLLYHSENKYFIPTLKQVIDTLNEFKNINLYIEIKQESINEFGLEVVVDSVLEDAKSANFNAIIISFSDDVVRYVQEFDPTREVGWVISEYDETHKLMAEKLKPDYIYCNALKIDSPATLWKGNWKWALYDVKDPDEALKFLNEGVNLIETGDIHALSESTFFN